MLDGVFGSDENLRVATWKAAKVIDRSEEPFLHGALIKATWNTLAQSPRLSTATCKFPPEKPLRRRLRSRQTAALWSLSIMLSPRI
jgi:hypothetical protein